LVCAFFIFLTMLRIGHRGAKGYVAENTLASFENAISLGVDGIELDVHRSVDGQIMVIHDETIDRTTSAKGFVIDFTAAELIEFGIPTLTNVIDAVKRRCFVNIEIKAEATAQVVVRLIEDYVINKGHQYDDFIISCFDWEVLKAVKLLNPLVRLGVLTYDNVDNALAFAKQNQAFSINPYFGLLTSENVKLIQKEGFQVHTWTVNTQADIEFVKSLQVEGIISDFPDRL
jgi:glycerophosphoryl diester phosphodiesterase